MKLSLAWTLTIIIMQLKKQDSISVRITKLSTATQVDYLEIGKCLSIAFLMIRENAFGEGDKFHT